MPYIPTQTPEEDYVAICYHQADSPLYVCMYALLSELVICELKEYDV